MVVEEEGSPDKSVIINDDPFVETSRESVSNRVNTRKEVKAVRSSNKKAMKSAPKRNP